jgi:WD40 repeat protein
VIPSDWSPDGRYSLEVTSNNFSTTEGPSFDVAVARYDALNMFAPQLITLVSDTVNAVRFSPLNNRVAIASGPLAMLDPEGNNSFSAYDNTGVTGLAYSHDGRSYATTEYTDGLAPFSGQRTRIRDVATNQVQKQFGDSITWNSTRTNQISFAPSDSLFAVGSILHGLDTSIGVKWPAGVYVNAFTPDSRSLYISNNDSVEVIDVASRTIRSTFPTGHHHVNAINFSADGSQFVTCGNDGLIRLWNTPNHTVARTYSGHRGSVTGVQFSPNGLYLLSSSLDSTIRVWDINTGNVVDSFTEFRAPYSDVQVSPDGKLIAGATPLAVVEYDAPKVALGVKPSGISAELSVSELYPNPSADKSVLNLVLPAREHVSIKIVDILGRTLAAPFDAVLEQGHHSFELSASELGLRQGTYFAEIITPARSVLRMLRIE